MHSDHADVVVVGAGIIGLSAAYHIAASSDLRVLVVDKSPSPGMGSTAKATGGFRQQFSSPINVMLSTRSLAEYEDFERITGQPMPLDKHGYLFVTSSADQLASLGADVEMQNSLGVPSRLVGVDEIRAMVPFAEVEDLLGGSFCSADGSAAPADAVNGYRMRARQLGVTMRLEERVAELKVTDEGVFGVAEDGYRFEADQVVNAAGVGAIDLAGSAGFDLPARPYRRQVFLAEPVETIQPGIPFFVDLDTGWYLHQERNGALLLGGTDASSRPGTEEVVDWGLFETMAAAASRRIPSVMEDLRFRGGTCGIRMLTPDQLPLIGRTAAVPDLVCATACNGHGFMHAPAAGRLIAEAVVLGAPASMDAAAISPDRFSNQAFGVDAVVF